MDFWKRNTEAFLRLSATLLLFLTACLLGFDTQSKVVFFINTKATFKKLQAFEVLVDVASAAAAYNLLQLSRCIFSSRFKGNSDGCSNYIYLAWLCYLLDQVVVYITFATNTAAVEHSVLAITGEEDFQWMKLCNKFTRFCIQAGGALLCGFLASIVMVFITFISAFNLFRLYSPRHLLRLKGI